MESGRSALVGEGAVQRFRTLLYDAIVASAKNAELLSSRDPSDVRIEECEGSAWIKESAARVCDWLDSIRAVSASSGVFESQVLGPVRAAAGYLSEIRRLSKPTADLDAWIFGVSRPYRYEYFDSGKITAFAVLPGLESVMSLRLDESHQDRVSPGFCRLGCAQPVPLVNRIHQPRPSFEKIGGRPGLDWDFMKAAFGDLDSPGSSAEMERFFEVESAQSGQTHHLGSAFILACKIAEVREPNILVQRVRGKETAEMALSERLAVSDELSGLSERAHARVLAVKWYGEDDEKLPEVLWIEPGITEREALADEMTGHVRARGSVPLAELESEFGNADLSGAKALSVEKGAASYVHKSSDADPVADAFLKASAQLRGLRARAGTGPSDWRDVLDGGKIEARGLIRLLKSRPRLLDVLARVQTSMDCAGEAAPDDEIAASAGLKPGEAKRHLWLLRRTGLAEKKDGRTWSTGVARGALAEALSGRIAEIEAASDVLAVPEIEDLPQSAVMARLARPGGEFAPLQDCGGANRLYWVRKSAGRPAILEAEKKLEKLYGRVLGIARGVSFPVTAKYVAEEAGKAGPPVSHLAAGAAAEGLARRGKLVPSGQSWEYPIAERVGDFVAENAGEFAVDEIASRARVAGRDRGLVVEALRSLEKSGRATRLSDGIWARAGGDIWSHYKEKIKIRALEIVRARKNGTDRNALNERLRRFVADIDPERRLPDHGQCIGDAVAELVAEGAVTVADGVCRAG